MLCNVGVYKWLVISTSNKQMQNVLEHVANCYVDNYSQNFIICNV